MSVMILMINYETYALSSYFRMLREDEVKLRKKFLFLGGQGLGLGLNVGDLG